MTRLIFLITILFLVNTLKGQSLNDWGAFGQGINAKQYLGKNFKLEAAVK